MTLITFQDGKPVIRDGKIGSGQECCCGPQCNCSSPGFTPISPSDPTRGLVWLTLESCTGSGASATVDAPNAVSLCDNQGGAIQGVTLTSPGSGYAKLGRTAPTVTVTGTSGSGSGGTFDVTLMQWQNYCGLDQWGVESVSLTGGEGYTPGDTLTFSFASGDTQETAAAGTIVGTQFGEPTLTLTPTGGTGGVLTIKNFTQSGDYWQIGDIEITQAGSGYADNSAVTITLDPGVVDAKPFGFPVPPLIRARTDGTGAITSVEFQLYPGGSPPPWRGAYKKAVQFAVNLTSVGAYYREDPTLPPYVPSVTVTVEQEPPSAGSGAVITATVNDDTSSPDFGKITSVQVEDGGGGYLDAPSACEFPDKIYVTFGEKTAEVPTTTDSFATLFFLPGNPTGFIPDGFGVSFPTGGAADFSFENLNGICTAGDCCMSDDLVAIPLADLQNMTPPFPQLESAFPLLWKSFSYSYGLAIRPNHYAGDYGPPGAKLLSCQCGDEVQLVLALVSECMQYRPDSPSDSFYDGVWYRYFGPFIYPPLRRKVFLYCLRFDKDENGCPVGDATVIHTTVFDPGQPPCEPVEDWYGNTVTDCTCNTECFDGITPVVSLLPP